MDIWQMKYFIQMYNDKSLSKASKNLYISQQALSKTLKKMENELDVPLFDRMIRGLKPTKFGDILYEKAKKIVYEYGEMIESFQNQEILKSTTLSIGTTNILYNDKLKALCYGFQETHPEITFELFEMGYYTCEEYLKEGRIDICFSLKPNNTAQFDYIPIAKYNMIILMNKNNSLSQKFSLSIRDLKNEAFIMLPADSKIRKLINESCLQSGFSPNIFFASSQLDIITELVHMNKGIAILPECIAERALNLSHNITVLTLRDCPFKIEAGFILNHNIKTGPMAKAIIDYHLKNL